MFEGSMKLTEREIEVLKLIVSENSSADIASYLNISVKSVESCASSLKSKTGARNKAELIVFAVKNGYAEIL